MDKREKYIQVCNLKKIYTRQGQDELNTLDDISFEVEKGESVCIVGSSGCGKSTLLRIMAGLDTEHEGEVLIDGKLIKKPNKQWGFVYQEHRLFPWFTVEQNINFVINGESKEDSKRKVKNVINLVGLESFENAYPKELSGGMAQRANIARALVNEPEILFLDEPFGALDALTKVQLQKELMLIRKKKNQTMILVTHDIEEAVYLGDRIIIMGDRPAKIIDVVHVNLPSERDRNSKEFLEVRRQVYKYFEQN